MVIPAENRVTALPILGKLREEIAHTFLQERSSFAKLGLNGQWSDLGHEGAEKVLGIG